MPILSGLGRRVLGILVSPRATYEALIQTPRWFDVLALSYLITAIATALLLETDVGQLALLDQWERTAAAFGQEVDAAQYAAMAEASQNGATYAAFTSFVSGPVLAFALSALLYVVFRASPVTVSYRQVLAVVAHAGVILAVRQLVAAPVTYASESLASPITMGVFFRMLDEGSPLARFFSIIDLFVLWWVMLLAVGMSVLSRRPARRLAGVFVGAYITLAVLLTVAMAVTGGTA
jgi:hypothetical protein